jgi:hypothetical protein
MGDKKFHPQLSFHSAFTYYNALKQPLGMGNLTSHLDMCQSNCVHDYVLMGDSNKFQVLICKRQL